MNNKILERLAIIETNIALMEKILIGAAALGFIEKLVSWWVR